MLMMAPREAINTAVKEKDDGIAKTFAKASYVGSDIVNELALDLGLKAAPTLAAAPSTPGLGGSPSSASPMTHFTQDEDSSDQSDQS